MIENKKDYYIYWDNYAVTELNVTLKISFTPWLDKLYNFMEVKSAVITVSGLLPFDEAGCKHFT